MTYIIDKVDKERIPYIEIYLKFTDARNNLPLSTITLCTVKKEVSAHAERIINSDNELEEYTNFCNMMFNSWKEHGLIFGAHFWKGKIAEVTEILNNWKRLLDSHEVAIEWEIKDTYKLETRSSRS